MVLTIDDSDGLACECLRRVTSIFYMPKSKYICNLCWMGKYRSSATRASAVHTYNRVLERYGVRINYDDYVRVTRMIQSGVPTLVHRSENGHRHIVKIHNIEVVFVFRKGRVVTAIPAGSLSSADIMP